MADDHQIMLDGINALLLNNNQYEVVALTTHPKQILELIEQHRANILITDISMQELSGTQLCKLAKEAFPDLKVLALSMFGDKETITEMIEAGVDAYVLKNTGTNELLNALDKLVAGEHYFSNEVTIEMMKSIAQPKTLKSDVSPLTPRETEIVKLISNELNNHQIGEQLFISERTVETHRKNIFRKTNTKSVAGLIKYAIENQII